MAFQSNQGSFPPKKKSGAAAGDDRNLVLVDGDFQGADFEDRVWLFWQRHGVKTVVSAVVVFIAIISFIVWREVESVSLSSLQAEYSAAKTVDEKLAFAKENASEALAGTAYFSVGGEFSEAGKYAEAAAAFDGAANVFSQFEEFSAMRDRARIAQAVALSRAGTPDSLANAMAVLKTLAQTPNADLLYRGQAMYELATLALVAENLAEARLWLDEMDRVLPTTNFWQAQKRALISAEPKLATPAAVPATESSPEAVPAA